MIPALVDKKKAALLILGAALAAAGIAALLVTIVMHKVEERRPVTLVASVDENTVDPKVWGLNFPNQYDGYMRNGIDNEKTRYGGSVPFDKLEADPHLKTLFDGYAFAWEYNGPRGHAYSLLDQEKTKRVTMKPQPGACIHCHGAVLPYYRQVGGGDVMKGFGEVCKMPLTAVHKAVTHSVSCMDCHDPATMALRVTRPGFLEGIKAYKAGQGVKDYDPNRDATRQELRTFVCAQCHVEYYFRPLDKRLTYPWAKGLRMDDAEAYYDEIKFSDWNHAQTGAPLLKAQHPEFETFSQGVHAKNGVACADCHMPYMRVGATKVSDHQVRSPLTNVRRACLQCHARSEQDMLAVVGDIQDRHHTLLNRAGDAVVAEIKATVKAREAGATDEELKPVWLMQRKAQWRYDYVAAENSMGFHAPQESARILAESIDYARQGECKAFALVQRITPERRKAREKPPQLVPHPVEP